MKIKEIRIDKIELKNFMNFEFIKIEDLSNFDFILVSGKNGSGKSSLTSESIFYNLFGSSLRGKSIKDLLNHEAEIFNEYGYVEITYRIIFDNLDNVENYLLYTIKRYLSHPKKKNGVEISFNIISDCKENYDRIYNFIESKKLNSYKDVNEFNKIIENVFVSKKEFLKINLRAPFSLSPVDSSDDELIDSIINIKEIYEIGDRLRNVIKELKKDLERYEKFIEKNESLISDLKKKDNKDLIEQRKEKKKELKVQLEKYKKERNEISKKIEELRKKLEIIKSKEDKGDRLLNKYLIEKNRLEEKRKILKKEIGKNEKLLNKNICPICKNEIDKDKIKNELDEYYSQIEILNNKTSELNNKIKRLEEKISEIKKNKNLIKNKIDKLESKEFFIKDKIIQIDGEIRVLDKLENSSDNKDLILKLENEIKEYKDEIKKLNQDIFELEKNYKILNKKSQDIKRYIKNKLKIFKNIFEKVLIDLYPRFYKVDLFKKNQFLILNNSISYSNLSTSEKKIVDIAFVISYLIYVKNKFPYILDEFFDNFDEENAINIFSKFQDYFQNKQIFITTNMSFLKEEISQNNKFKEIDITKISS